MFRKEEVIDDYVRAELQNRVDALVAANFSTQNRVNVVFAVLIALQLGLFLFEGYIVFKGYKVVLRMQESYKKSLDEYNAVPYYKDNGNERTP